VSDRPFGDFELDARADWPADTGIMLRRRPDTWEGIQVLFDYRQSGSIGGFYGNGIGAFHVVPFAIDAKRDEEGRVIGLKLDDPATSVEPFTPAKREPLSAACTFEEFEAIWRWEDWNHFSIRCVGDCPTVTVRINGLLVAELDLARLKAENFDPQVIMSTLGTQGHIAFEDPTTTLASGRLAGPQMPHADGATCRSESCPEPPEDNSGRAGHVVASRHACVKHVE